MANTRLGAQDPILEWSAPQHPHPTRGTLWYICATIIIALSMLYSVMTRAWTFGVLLIVITIIYACIHRNPPPTRRMRLYKHGCAIDERFTEWVDCTGYWIVKGDGYYELNIEKRSGARLCIHIGDMDPYALHEVLGHFLEELSDRKERLSDAIIRICKL